MTHPAPGHMQNTIELPDNSMRDTAHRSNVCLCLCKIKPDFVLRVTILAVSSLSPHVRFARDIIAPRPG